MSATFGAATQWQELLELAEFMRSCGGLLFGNTVIGDACSLHCCLLHFTYVCFISQTILIDVSFFKDIDFVLQRLNSRLKLHFLILQNVYSLAFL